MSFYLFIENDQLVESRGRKELNAGEIEEQIFARFLLYQSEQLITELLNIGGINDFAVEKANHRDIARAAGQIGDFNTTMNSHYKNSYRTAATNQGENARTAAFLAVNSVPNLPTVCNSSGREASNGPWPIDSRRNRPLADGRPSW